MNRSSLALCLVLLVMLLVTGVASASPKISGISPSSGRNDGMVQVTITGSGFDTVNLVRLNKCKLKSGDIVNVAPFAGSIIHQSSSAITAEFDLTGKRAGYYELSVKALVDGHDEWDYKESAFEVYQAGTTTAPTTTTTGTAETTEPTASAVTTASFSRPIPMAQPSLWTATRWEPVPSPITPTDEGIHDVLVKKLGYEDYSDRVTIIEDTRVRFYAQLTPLSASSVTTSATTAASGSPAKTVTTIRKSTLKIPTPLGTFAPPAEESPVNPAVVLLAAGIGAVFVVLRRR